jgi:hypothetical protein
MNSSIPIIINYKPYIAKDSSAKRYFDYNIHINKFKKPIKNIKFIEYNDNLEYENDNYSIDNNNKLIIFPKFLL